jgi:hypothetical protein
MLTAIPLVRTLDDVCDMTAQHAALLPADLGELRREFVLGRVDNYGEAVRLRSLFPDLPEKYLSVLSAIPMWGVSLGRFSLWNDWLTGSNKLPSWAAENLERLVHQLRTNGLVPVASHDGDFVVWEVPRVRTLMWSFG